MPLEKQVMSQRMPWPDSYFGVRLERRSTLSRPVRQFTPKATLPRPCPSLEPVDKDSK